MFERIILTRVGVKIEADANGVTFNQMSPEMIDQTIFIVRGDIPELIKHLQAALDYKGD